MIYIIGNDGTPQRVDGVGNELYPVGSIYMSTTNTSPASMFGGTWEQIKDKFLLSAGDTYSAGISGGNAIHSHTLDNGYAKIVYGWASGGKNNFLACSHKNIGSNIPYKITTSNDTSYVEVTYNYNWATELGGNSDNSSNMPPYLAVYCWKRIS